MVLQAEATKKSMQFLESAVREYDKIIIDTCSLLDRQADIFWENIVPILKREKKTVIVPLRVYEEVVKYANNPDLCVTKNDHSLHSLAVRAKDNILRLRSDRVVEIFGDASDEFADHTIITVIQKFRLKYNWMLITQDHNLASEVNNITKSKAVITKKRILVERINRHGFISLFKDNVSRLDNNLTTEKNAIPHRESSLNVSIKERITFAESDMTKTGKMSVSYITEGEKFAFAESVSTVTGKITVSYIPVEGDTVTAEYDGQRKPVKLVKAGPSGGEGSIYFTDLSDFVAKIYKQDKLDKSKLEKIKLMLTKKIECDGVCFPVACLFNVKNEFVGYLMKKAHGKELQKCVFIPKLLAKIFPDWQKKDTVQLCITILNKIKYLHDRNVILGDINPNNILVVSPLEVYFVDTDSYQIEGYPCPVGTINFTAPEIQRKPSFGSFLRTIENERFAVATLLFMIMLPGKPPYSLQGGENQIDNIINMDFAYASGEKSTGKAPDGMWRFCWSHLPRFLKDAFYDTFHKNGKNSTHKTRYTTGNWLQKFEAFMELLASGKYAAQDEMSLELFPERLKKNPNITYVKCRGCNKEFAKNRIVGAFCRNCQNRMIFERVNCANCNSLFEITYGEREFFESRELQLPRRCPSCRGKKGEW